LSIRSFQFNVPEDNANADECWSQFITPIYKAIDDFILINVRNQVHKKVIVAFY